MKFISTTKGFRLNLKEKYPEVYQELVAQGLANEQMEKDRTNEVVIQAVENARKSNPLAVRMNELAAVYQEYLNTPVSVKFNELSDKLVTMCYQNTRFRKKTVISMLQKVMQQENPWFALLEEMQPEFIPEVKQEIRFLLEEASKLLKDNREYFRKRKAAGMEMEEFNRQHKFAHHSFAPYYYIDDGLIILEYDERILKPELMDSESYDDEHECYYRDEVVEFKAFVNPSLVKKLVEEQNPELMLEYIELIRKMDAYGGYNCHMEQFPILDEFLAKHPNI